jgi:hypothetical protein
MTHAPARFDTTPAPDESRTLVLAQLIAQAMHVQAVTAYALKLQMAH